MSGRGGKSGRGEGRGGRGEGRGGWGEGRGGRGGGRGGRGRGGDGGGRGRGGDGGGRGRGGGGGRSSTQSISPQQAEQRTKAILTGLRISCQVQQRGSDQFAPRPDSGGTCGKSIQVRTNFFPVTCGVNEVYQYALGIRRSDSSVKGIGNVGGEDVERLPRKLATAIVAQCAEENRWPRTWAFDGKYLLFSVQKIVSQRSAFTVAMRRGGRDDSTFEVILAPTATIDIKSITNYLSGASRDFPAPALQALDVCLKSSLREIPNCISMGRTFVFNDPQTNRDLSGGLELWQGRSQSLCLCESGLALNVDIAYAAFIKPQSAIDMLLSLTKGRSVNDLRRLSDRDLKRVSKEFKGLRIIPTHRESKKKYKCVGFTRESAERASFPINENTKGIVSDYWKHTYGELRYPWLPCLDCSKGKHLTYFPIEICNIIGGERKLNLDDDQTRDFLRTCALRPAERRTAIQQTLSQTDLSRNPLLANFKMEVNDKGIIGEARVLPQPFLQYALPECVDPGSHGSWNLAGVKLYEGAKLKSWAVVSFAQDNPNIRNDLHSFLQNLIGMMRGMNLTVENTLPPVIHAVRMDCTTALQQAKSAAASTFRADAELIMVLLPRRENFLYKELKGTALGAVGVMTQCIVARNAGIGSPSRGQEQYQANLVMKINQKLGGINCRLARSLSTSFPPLGCMENRPYIVFGGDVTHPTSHDTSEPSVGAIVASMDSHLSQFAAKPLFLGHRQETMDMAVGIQQLLQIFYQKNHVKPDAVIFYRDGVSDGQFQSVVSHEYEEFQKAFRALDPDYKPTITYIVVQKRHNARFSPVDSSMADRNGNTLPGTVMDKIVSASRGFNFYLNAHAGIQGTNKAAHYHVLVDENGFGSDGIQLMTNWMCYLYCRCTRSVSYAPPAYYAHHAALSFKYLLHSESESASSQGHGNTERTIHQNVANQMFFV